MLKAAKWRVALLFCLGEATKSNPFGYSQIWSDQLPRFHCGKKTEIKVMYILHW